MRSKYCVAREFGGKSNNLLFKIPVGAKVPVYAVVSTTKLNKWLYIKYNGCYGWVIKTAFKGITYKIPNDIYKVAGTPDNSLTCRIGAGTEYRVFKKIKSLPNGKSVKVINELTAADGSKWKNIYVGGYFCFVSSIFLKK